MLADYKKLWLGFFLSGIGRWTYYIVISHHVQSHFSSLIFGAWVSSYIIPTVLLSLFLGKLVDRNNKRTLILLSFAFVSLAPITLTVFDSVPCFFIVSQIDAIFSTTIYLASRSWIKQLTHSHKSFINSHAFLVLAQLLPNMIGSSLSAFSLGTIVLEQAIAFNFLLNISACSLVLFTNNVECDFAKTRRSTTEILKHVMNNMNLFTPIYILSISTIAYSVFNGFFIFYWEILFDKNSFFFGLSILFSGIAIIAGTFMSKTLFLKIDRKAESLFSSSFLTVFLIGLLSIVPPQKAFLITIIFLIQFFYAATRNTHTLLLVTSSDHKIQASVISISLVSWNLVSLLCMLIAGYFVDKSSLKSVLLTFSLLSLSLLLLLKALKYGKYDAVFRRNA